MPGSGHGNYAGNLERFHQFRSGFHPHFTLSHEPSGRIEIPAAARLGFEPRQLSDRFRAGCLG